MESTKVVSLRVAMGTYETIILECEVKGITITEWFERKISMAKNAKKVKKDIVEKLSDVFHYGLELPLIAKRRLNNVIRYIDSEL
jgi:hypothetical protein